MRLAALVLVAGCDRLFFIDGISPIDAPGDGIHDARGGDGPLDAPSGLPPMLVQEMHGAVAGAVAMTVTLPDLPTSGDVLVAIGGSPSSTFMDTISGGGVPTWQLAVDSKQSPTEYIWYGLTDGTSAGVTIAPANGTNDLWLVVTEWRHVSAGPIDSIDGSGMRNGNGGVALQVNTTGTQELLVFGVSCYGTVSAPAGWTVLPLVTGGSVQQRAFYRLASTPGADGVAASCGGTDWDAALAAFHNGP